MHTHHMFRVTAVKTDPKHGNDPTKWMSGVGNSPPPWRWLEYPDRAQDCKDATIKMPHKPSQSLVSMYEENNVLLRFKQAHKVMAYAYSICQKRHVATFKFPVDTVLGEDARQASGHHVGEHAEDAAARATRKPFRSPKYWAGFVVTGDGSQVEPIIE